MKNKMSDLNNHLFASLERLSEEDLKGEELAEEIERAKAINGVSTQIISGASLVLRAQIAAGESIRADMKLPPMLTVEEK